MLGMVGVAGYVGAEPQGLRLLADALGVAELEVRYANDRIQALLIEAGEGDVTCGALLRLTSEINTASADVRRRAAVAEETAAILNTPVCVVPWYDPLRRAASAAGRNGWRLGEGAVNSAEATGSLIWQLAPTHDGWRQSWVDLRVAAGAAWRDPSEAFHGIMGRDELREEGFSYWIGGFVPDLVAGLAGGAGAGKRLVTTAEAAGRTRRLEIGRRLQQGGRAVVARHQNVVEGDSPDGLQRLLPDPVLEPLAKARVLKLDELSGGHSAARHGPETTLEQQRVRAATGIAPDGKPTGAQDSSRFLRWQDQDEAIRRALVLRPLKPYRDIRFDHVVGEGYLKGGTEYVATKVVRVKFDNRGRPYTSFPYLKVVE